MPDLHKPGTKCNLLVITTFYSQYVKELCGPLNPPGGTFEELDYLNFFYLLLLSLTQNLRFKVPEEENSGK